MTGLNGRMANALTYALQVHEGDLRKGTNIPYIAHPLGVCALVMEDGGDEDEAIAALLHDTAEDHGGRDRIEDIRKRFGERVARIVEECSDSLAGPRDETDWQTRKENYIAEIARHSPEAIRVSLADKLHNARAIVRDLRAAGEDPARFWGRFHAGHDAQLWYYRSLVAVFRSVRESSMVDDLAATVEHMGQT